MTTDERTRKLHEIVDAMVGEPRLNALRFFSDPFDVDPPTQHATKAAFAMEKTAVTDALRHIEALFESLRTRAEDGDERKTALNLTIQFVDKYGKSAASSESIESARDLVINNVLANGLYFNAMLSVAYFRRSLIDRAAELLDQEKEFWSTSHRPPNYYARTIALGPVDKQDSQTV